MRVTVCEIANDPQGLIRDWERLAMHVQTQSSELVVLPEMPFYPWLAFTRAVDRKAWDASVAAHDDWIQRFSELSAASVVATRPTTIRGRHYNEGFIWGREVGCRAVHTKYFLPDEEGFWEASWYERGRREFAAVRIGGALVGFLICTELWFSEHARAYGKAGVHLLVCPRATPASTRGKWLSGGRSAAVVSGAYCLSSCFGGTDQNGMHWAGNGWIIEPEEGKILAVTSPDQPFITLDIDLHSAESAKQTYPRYVRE